MKGGYEQADANKNEENRWNQMTVTVHLMVHWRKTVIIQVPKQMENNHESDCHSPYDVRFNEPLFFHPTSK